MLPALILTFDKLIYKHKHKTISLKFDKLSNIVTTHYKVFILIFLVLLVPSIFGSQKAKVYYNIDETLPSDMPSVVATNKLKDKFNMMTTHFILISDDVKAYKIKEIADEIKDIQGISNVISYDSLVGPRYQKILFQKI